MKFAKQKILPMKPKFSLAKETHHAVAVRTHQHALTVVSLSCGLICVVVIWCDMLGALHWRQDSLSWSGPSLSPQPSGEWAQTGQAK